jgi:4-phospho-D-threonate 3-dehydrogenase / 4-phospho-D-erythronate 3-dehydrogenase
MSALSMKTQLTRPQVIVPMVSPFCPDYTIDREAVCRMIEIFADAGVSVFVLGTTGEGDSLSDKQCETLVSCVVKETKGRSEVYAGLAGNSLTQSIRNAEKYHDLGAGYLVAKLPACYPMDETQMLLFLEKLADSVPLPLFIYNIPATTHHSIPLHIVEKLSYHPNILGLKDSERNMERLNESVRLWGKRDDFSFLIGWAAMSATGLLKGANGIVPSTANFCPDLYVQMIGAIAAGDEKAAVELQEKTDRISALYQNGRTLSQSIPALKSMMKMKGLCSGTVLPPLIPFSKHEESIFGDEVKNELEILSPIRKCELLTYSGSDPLPPKYLTTENQEINKTPFVDSVVRQKYRSRLKMDSVHSQNQEYKPILAITMGDPAGIGPEIAARVFAMPETFWQCRPLLTGNAQIMQKAVDLLKSNLKINAITNVQDAVFQMGTMDVFHLPVENPESIEYGKISVAAGDIAFRSVEKAIELALAGVVDGTVTNPIHKGAIHAAGHHFSGHTEIYAHYTRTPKYAMLLADDKIKVIHVSTHVSLRKACDLVKKERVSETIRLLNDGLKLIGMEHPRIGVAGLNPHAGDGGLFGEEEIFEIVPAIELAVNEGILAEGPFPPDTLFALAKGGRFDGCVAMYHDQGHIPFKLDGFQWDEERGAMKSVKGVNITLGLPIIRTSVDHGTAFEIAGKGIANPGALVCAINYALKIFQSELKS